MATNIGPPAEWTPSGGSVNGHSKAMINQAFWVIALREFDVDDIKYGWLRRAGRYLQENADA